MKFLGKLILWLLVALLLVIIGAWFLLQTHWGARQASAWLSNGTGWQVSFDEMEHDFSSPLHVQLRNVTFGREGKPATLVAKTVDIGFSTRQFSDPLHADEIVLNDGTLNLSPHSADLPFAADRLMLRNMAFNSPETGWALSAQRVTGGVSPWTPEAGNVLGKTAQIQMSAGSMTLNGVEASNVLIQGKIDQGEVTLSTLGADVARGTLTGNAKRSADGSWRVDNLQLNEIRLQSPASLAEFFAPLTTVPSLQIGRLDITDARLQGPDWAVTDLDLSLRNLTLSHGGWQSEDGTLSMNASEFIYGSLHLFDPILNAEFSPQGIALRQFSSRWEGGMVRTSGNWLRAGNALVLDDTAFAGLEYTLPHELETAVDDATASLAAKPDAEKIQRQPQSDHRCGPCFPVANYRPRWLWRRATAGEKRQLGSMERQRDAERRGGDFQPDRRAPPITQTERHSLDGQYH